MKIVSFYTSISSIAIYISPDFLKHRINESLQEGLFTIVSDIILKIYLLLKYILSIPYKRNNSNLKSNNLCFFNQNTMSFIQITWPWNSGLWESFLCEKTRSNFVSIIFFLQNTEGHAPLSVVSDDFTVTIVDKIPF